MARMAHPQGKFSNRKIADDRVQRDHGTIQQKASRPALEAGGRQPHNDHKEHDDRVPRNQEQPIQLTSDKAGSTLPLPTDSSKGKENLAFLNWDGSC